MKENGEVINVAEARRLTMKKQTAQTLPHPTTILVILSAGEVWLWRA
jgi:hypothetical protein